MYANQTPRTPIDVRMALTYLSLGLAGLLSFLGNHAAAQPNVVRNITSTSERLELTVNSSRILTLEKRIPRMVVNNPGLITVTALSANQIQIAALKPGVTQINLWDEDGKVFTVDVSIYGDVRELQLALTRLFPESSVKVVRLTNSLVLEGFVERPEAVSPIIRLAEDYAPKIINNITVGGVQQVMLKVKVMEVSRTKLRQLGMDWADFDGVSYISSSISGLISSASEAGAVGAGGTFSGGVVSGGGTFFYIMDALQQKNVAKVLADPTITTVSGRPAEFHVGGEFPIIVPAGQGQSTVEYKKFGTQINFLPIVLGNGNLRLEVRAVVSEPDPALGVELQGFTVPALKNREIDTGVEIKAGQTLALAGLVQTRVEARHRGLPFVSDIPYLGAPFRSVSEEVNEIELLILVTPEFADGIDPHEVPPCGPGMETVSPSNRQLYFGGKLEVPTCGVCAPGSYGGQCGANYSISTSPGGATIIASDAFQSKPLGAYGGSMQIEAPMPMIIGPAEQAPISQPKVPSVNPSPADKALPGSATSLKKSWLQNQASDQFSSDHSSYSNAIQQPVNTTTTPGLIGPQGYDVEN